LPGGLATSDGSAVANPGDAGALPVGIQIVGPHFSENKLLEAAFAFEQATDFVDGPWSWGS
jgi:aspartyl-tRNA(Asn)/glutamyl-tRNA(Gln) amidotransferase subunit A